MVKCSRCAVGKEQNEVERQKVKLLEEMEREVMDIQHGGSRQQRDSTRLVPLLHSLLQLSALIHNSQLVGDGYGRRDNCKSTATIATTLRPT